MSILSRLFGGNREGGGSATEVEPTEYKGFRIYPESEKSGSHFRLRARIEKEVDGETRRHELIRADMLEDRQTAETISVDRAKRVIDEQGEGLFR